MATKPTYEELEKRVEELEKDLTSRKMIEDTFHENTSFLKDILDKAAEGICVCHNIMEEPYVRFIHWNLQMSKITGYTMKEINNLGWYQSMYPDPEVQNTAIERMTRMREGDNIQGEEWVITTKSGMAKPVTISTSVVKEKKGTVYVMAVIQDISDRRQAEKALKESEEKYRLLIENIPSVTWITSEHCKTTFISSNVEKIYGFSQEEIYEGKDSVWFKRIHSEDVESVEDSFKKLFSDNQKFDIEYRIQRKDGKWIWVHDMAFKAYEEDGVTYAYGIFSDITDRKQNAKDLRDSEERFRLLSEASFEGIGITEKGVILDANKQIAEMFGYEVHELIGMQVMDMVAPESRDHVKKKIESGVQEPYEHLAIKKDGSIVHVEVNGKSIPYEGRMVRVTAIQDITERKKAEEALHNSEERYRSLVENTMDGCFICEIPSGRFIFLNQRICDLAGYTMEEGLGLTIWDVLTSEEHKLAKERIQDRIVSKKPSFASNVYKAVRKDGSKFKAEVSTSLITYENKPVIQGILRDVTEKERLTSQLQQAQKMESIGTLAGGIAHDFNNLLMGIQGRISLLNMEIGLPDTLFEHIKGIEDCVKSATNLTKQLLGFARGGKYEVKPIDLNHLIKNVSYMFGRTKKEISIYHKLQENLLGIEADKTQIEQVLLNIFVNAWQAMPTGGEIYVHTENREIGEEYVKPFSTRPGNYVKISITDTGHGMDEITRQKIFDPFFSTKGMGKGTGLGLASAYGIIKNHGGFINVYSEKEKGTTFIIYLPASDKILLPEEKESTTEIIEGSETVLLIDDEQMVIDVGKKILEKLGYKVIIANSGRSAIQHYQENFKEINIVILDMIMPDINGEETYNSLKSINPDVKVLLSSGYSINGQAQEIMSRGCDGFIQKPFSINEMSQKLREILDKD